MGNRILSILTISALVLCCAREAEYAPVIELGSPQAEGLVTVPADGGDINIAVYANGDFEVVLNDSWISFSGQDAQRRSASFFLDENISISIKENPELTRYGSITLIRENRTLPIQIRQRGRKSSDAGIITSLVGKTSSSLTFTWYRDVDGETSSEADYNYPYRFALYRDAAATDLVVSYETPAAATCWSKAQPSFAFGGLQQGTSYYFLCEELGYDEVGNVVALQHSDILEVATADFTPVTIPERDANVGEIILAEDWSLCPWYSDMLAHSAGFLPAEELRTALTSPSGVNPAGTFTAYTSESELFSSSYSRTLVDASRMGGWAKHYDHNITGRTSVYMHAGHLKIGGSSYTAHLVTPEFSCIPEGFEATVEVKVKLARYGTDSDMTYIGSARGTSGSREDYGNYFKPVEYDNPGVHFAVQSGWNEYTVTLSGVRKKSRLLIGPDFELAGTGNGASQHRLMVGEITVKLLELEPVKIVVKGLRCYKAFSERICMEWDDLVPADLYTSDTYARAYQLEVYRDQALTDLYISAYSYNGSGKDEGAFPGVPSSSICGKADGIVKAYPTRATAGFLEPSTTYWFRVRSVDGVEVSNLKDGSTVTLTNVAGTSEWCEPVAVSTLAARTPSAKEVIFSGFDRFVGADWTCYAAGIGPKLATPATYATIDMSSYQGEWCMYGMYSYSSMQMPLWGLSVPNDGGGEGYLHGSTLSYGSWTRNNYVDQEGWHYDSQIGSLMGQLHLCDMIKASNSGLFFGTPPLEKNLTDQPQTCVVSFGVFAVRASYDSATSKELYVKVWHADTGVIDDGVKVTVPVRYLEAKPDKNNYTFDTTLNPVSAEVTLRKGDAVIVANQMESNRIILDDFLIELK